MKGGGGGSLQEEVGNMLRSTIRDNLQCREYEGGLSVLLMVVLMVVVNTRPTIISAVFNHP